MSRWNSSKYRPRAARPRRWAVVVLAGAGIAAVGCGDNRATPVGDAGGGDADAMAAACPGDMGPIDPTLLIDDFEHGSANLPLIAGRVGSWYAAGDATMGAIMQPLGSASARADPRRSLRQSQGVARDRLGIPRLGSAGRGDAALRRQRRRHQRGAAL